MTIKTIQAGKLAGLYEFTAEPYTDERGFMCRVYEESLLKEMGLNTTWAQESYSWTQHQYTLRGLHVSLPPLVEGKMIIPLAGITQWIAVDLRENSDTFGQWQSVILDASKHNALYAQKGFAHGALALTDNCGLYLKADSIFQDATGLLWNDPELAIEWQLGGHTPILSNAHQCYPSFADFKIKHGSLKLPA